MKYRVWYSTESLADYIIQNTDLHKKRIEKKKLYESDANNSMHFHTMPDHIKKILYLDAPDIVVEIDAEPIFSIEVSTEAGTGHNVFQRFARLAASVENNVPAFYVYPEAVIIKRNNNSATKWDTINPLVFNALEKIMNIYSIPALMYYYPSDFRRYPDSSNAPHYRSKGIIYDRDIKYAGCPDSRNDEMRKMFKAINSLLQVIKEKGVSDGRRKIITQRVISERRIFMQGEYHSKKTSEVMSPLTATELVATKHLIKYLSKYTTSDYRVGELLRSRKQSIIYKINANFRGDPYPGALAAIDYLKCRQGQTFEDREYNLVIAWGNYRFNGTEGGISLTGRNCTIKDFVKTVQASEKKNLLGKKYRQLKNNDIPRYYMQVRYGSTFSKVKHIRVYSYFADAIIFPDGALWRDA